jgi:hypothetical protein
VAIAPLFAQQSEKSGLKGTSLLRAPAGPIKLMGKGTSGKGKVWSDAAMLLIG